MLAATGGLGPVIPGIGPLGMTPVVVAVGAAPVSLGPPINGEGPLTDPGAGARAGDPTAEAGPCGLWGTLDDPVGLGVAEYGPVGLGEAAFGPVGLGGAAFGPDGRRAGVFEIGGLRPVVEDDPPKPKGGLGVVEGAPRGEKGAAPVGAVGPELPEIYAGRSNDKPGAGPRVGDPKEGGGTKPRVASVVVFAVEALVAALEDFPMFWANEGGGTGTSTLGPKRLGPRTPGPGFGAGVGVGTGVGTGVCFCFFSGGPESPLS